MAAAEPPLYSGGLQKLQRFVAVSGLLVSKMFSKTVLKVIFTPIKHLGACMHVSEVDWPFYQLNLIKQLNSVF